MISTPGSAVSLNVKGITELRWHIANIAKIAKIAKIEKAEGYSKIAS
jgi:hypothetical protein